MRPPDELMTSMFLPSMRQLVSHRLRAEGYSQNKISSMLGVTQASVSLYLGEDVERAYADLSKFSLGREDVERYAALLSEDAKGSPIDSVNTLMTIWTRLLGKGLVCDAHRKMHPSLARCDVCLHLFGSARAQGSDLIEEAERAVGMIEHSPVFHRVMPEVSVNIACVRGNSESPRDVVAVPGRIVRVKDRAKAMFPPEFGASGHLSKMLLLVRKKVPRHCAGINLTYDRKIAKIIQRLGIRTITIGGAYPESAEDPTVAALSSRLLRSETEFDAIVAAGGTGIEPSLYLFGGSATEVAALAIRIAELYSAS